MDSRYGRRAVSWQLRAAFAFATLLGACSQNGDARSNETAMETRLPRRGDSTEETRLPQSEVTPELAQAAQQLLEKHTDAPLGSEFTLEYAGKRYVARIEEHYHEPGGPDRPYGQHRGVTLYRPKR